MVPYAGSAFVLLLSLHLIVASSRRLSPEDFARAHLPRPLPSSHVVGRDPESIFASFNRHLRRQPHQTRPCDSYSLDELNDLARLLWDSRSEALADVYDERGDRRGFHFKNKSIAYKEGLWQEEKSIIASNPSVYGKNSDWYSMVRDGKCSEMVMWWVHHLEAETRTRLSAIEGFAVPLMPSNLAKASKIQPRGQHRQLARQKSSDKFVNEYTQQVSCIDCHWNANANMPVNIEDDDSPPAGTCPLHPITNKPTVWYEPMSSVGKRLKRCDWDYDPPCGLCEGIGGYAWGDHEHQIAYVDCEPIALAEDLPADNITTPIWPTSFVVNQPFITMINQLNYGGQFPGPDPCAKHVFHNDTELLHYDDSRKNFVGPILYMQTKQTHFYQLPNADVFIKIDDTFCICVSPDELGGGIGPLVHNFAHDAVLIGRERVGLEGLNTSVIADHWNKGPHHFWISVETNKYVRGWQPWNGLNVYEPGTWQIGPIDKKVFQPPESCFKGLLHKNISCKAPYNYSTQF